MTTTDIKHVKIHKTAILVGGGDILNGKQDNLFIKMFSQLDNQEIVLGYIPIAIINMPNLVEKFDDYLSNLKVKIRKLDSRVRVESVDLKSTTEQIKELIKRADIIFISGGDTQFLIDFFKREKLDSVLLQQYERGKIIVGNSAGALAMAKIGYSFLGGKIAKYEGVALIKEFIPLVHFQVPVLNKKNLTKVKGATKLPDDVGCIVKNDVEIEIIGKN